MWTYLKSAAIGLVLLGMAFAGPARAQMQVGIPTPSYGYCQVPAASLASAAGFSACVAATFTGTCSGSVLTASAVTGAIGVGWTITGTGMLTNTTVLSLGTGTGGAGTYNMSAPCTSSAAALTSVGPPIGANGVLLQAEVANIRFRDDGAVPTTTVGQLLIFGQQPFLYTGIMKNVQFIDAAINGVLDATFYRTSSP